MTTQQQNAMQLNLDILQAPIQHLNITTKIISLELQPEL